MPIEILMPALSPTMTEGTLAKWIKNEGDKVKPGQIIAEIETDKATMEVEAVDEGVIGKILIPAGSEGVKVNELIALLLEEGEDKGALEGYSGKWQVASGQKKEESGIKNQESRMTAPAAAPQPSLATSHLPLATKQAASPLAKRVAALEGIDLSRVSGTGPHGRIVKADVLEAKTRGGGNSPQGIVRRAQPEVQEIKNNTMRKTIAKRLVESKQSVPHFYLTIDCALDALLEARKQLNALAMRRAGEGKEPEYKLSVNDMIVKAVAMGLHDVPEANASWTENAIQQYTNVDVSVAVALEGGLVTPVVRNADQKTLPQLSAELKSLIAKARAGKLLPEEWQGGGFSISNLGMYGIKKFSAIINPPQSCILAVGAGEERVVAEGGQVKVIQAMTVTLSCDHRVVDGAVGAKFLSAFKRYIEEPLTMLA